MAVVNVLSTQLANLETTVPPLLNQPAFVGANDFTAIASVTSASTDSIGSTYRLLLLPSNAIVFDVQVMNTANTSSTYGMGLYAYQAGGGGALITNCANVLIPSGTSMATARSVWTSLFFPAVTSGSASAANLGSTLWQLAGATSDPGVPYEIVLTTVAAGSVGGTMVAKFNWTR